MRVEAHMSRSLSEALLVHVLAASQHIGPIDIALGRWLCEEGTGLAAVLGTADGLELFVRGSALVRCARICVARAGPHVELLRVLAMAELVCADCTDDGRGAHIRATPVRTADPSRGSDVELH